MAERHVEKLALLSKMESSYAVDPTPTGGANATIAKNVTIEPMLGTDIDRNLLLPYMGNQGIILTGNYTRIAYDIEIAGAGAAGDVPLYGPHLRMCGLDETVNEDVDVQYSPISGAFESGTHHYFLDGVRHILLGARGKLSCSLKALDLGHFRFEMTGLHGTITDQAMPTVDLDDWVEPLAIGDGISSLSLHGVTQPVKQLDLDWGQVIETRFRINQQKIAHVDRESTGTIVLEAASMATKNWFTVAKTRPRVLDDLTFVHGTTPGNIVQIVGAQTQIGRPSHAEDQKLLDYSLPLFFLPSSAGNDELVITVK